MRLYRQLVLFVLGATVLPLVVGFVILYFNEQQLRQRLVLGRNQALRSMAESLDAELRELFERVHQAAHLANPEAMNPEELSGWLGVVYKQSEKIIEAALVDEQGRETVPAVFLERPGQYPEYAGRTAANPDSHKNFLARLPRSRPAARDGGSVIVSEAYPRGGQPALALACPLVTASGRKLTVGVEVSLGWLQRRLREWQKQRQWQIWLAESSGRLVAQGDAATPEAHRNLANHPAWPGGRPEQAAGAFFSGEALHAWAVVPSLGWLLLASQSGAAALAGVRQLRRVTAGWTVITMLALLLAGAAFTRRITRRLDQLMVGTEKLGAGHLDTRVKMTGGDEIAKLAHTFNLMAEQLQRSHAEIEAWNQELSQRVEARTRELEIAHRRLLETSKLAAIGQLGAGVAHEINNPLVGILGNVQLLLAKPPAGLSEKERGTLGKIEAAARRCREVVQNLLRFSEQDQDAEHVEVELHRVLEDAYSLTAQQMEQLGIAVRWEVASGLVVIGDHRQLMRAFLNLLANARTAMQQAGGVLLVETVGHDGQARVRIKDTGRGMTPEQLERIFEPFFTTKDVWTNTGLGLSVAYRIISDHGGRIEVDSEPGKGSEFRVILPLAGEEQV